MKNNPHSFTKLFLISCASILSPHAAEASSGKSFTPYPDFAPAFVPYPDLSLLPEPSAPPLPAAAAPRYAFAPCAYAEPFPIATVVEAFPCEESEEESKANETENGEEKLTPPPSIPPTPREAAPPPIDPVVPENSSEAMSNPVPPPPTPIEKAETTEQTPIQDPQKPKKSFWSRLFTLTWYQPSAPDPVYQAKLDAFAQNPYVPNKYIATQEELQLYRDYSKRFDPPPPIFLDFRLHTIEGLPTYREYLKNRKAPTLEEGLRAYEEYRKYVNAPVLPVVPHPKPDAPQKDKQAHKEYWKLHEIRFALGEREFNRRFDYIHHQTDPLLDTKAPNYRRYKFYYEDYIRFAKGEIAKPCSWENPPKWLQ